MTDNRPPHPGPIRGGRRPPQEASQVIRRDPNYRPPPPPRRPPDATQPIAPPRAAAAATSAATATAGRPPPPPRRPPPPPRRPAATAAPRAKARDAASAGATGVASWWPSCCSLVLALVGTGVWIDTSLHRIPALTALPDRPPAGSGTTWLLVGSDSRQDLTAEQQAELATGGDVGNGRTDTILLVHVPGLGSDVPTTMVSIPRDSYVPIPGYGEDKINAAFALGGAPLLAQTVEQATGLRLDHYAEIGFDGFAVMVDAVGGVTMCPPEPISDPLAGIDLPAGCQELDGRSALGYVRTRATPRADLDRMTNQREFMADADAPRREPRRPAQPAALVPDGARGVGRGDRRRTARTCGIWPGWRGRCTGPSPPRPCRSASSPAATRVRSWCGTTTRRRGCSTRWRPTRAVPQDVLDAGNG